MNRRNSSEVGFTLIEVMVVVVIVGILATIAYPSYQDVVRQTRRADGVSALSDVMSRQERSFTDFNTYTTDLAALGYTLDSNSKYVPGGGYYLVSASICATGVALNRCVLLTATGQNGQENDGSAGACKTLTLNSQGVKTPTSCWKK